MDQTMEGMRAALAERLRSRAATLLEGAAEDVEAWAAQLTADAVEAASQGRADLLLAVQEQARAVAEAQRLRVTSAALAELRLIIGDVFAGLSGLAAQVKP